MDRRVSDGQRSVRYYVYDRASKKSTFLFTNRPNLEGLPLQKMHARVIDSRDGMKLVSYLTLPPGTDPDGDGIPDNPVPMVLNVHGGPWARDDWGFDASINSWRIAVTLCERELPRFDWLRQGLWERRQQRVGRQDAQ